MSWRKYRKVQNFFSYNRKRNQKNDKSGNEDITAVSYKIKFIDSARFMANSLSNLVEFIKLNPKIVIAILNTKV